MSTPVVTVDAGDDVRATFPIFHDHAVRRVVVVDGGGPIGVLSVDDLVMNLVGDLGDLVRPITAEVLFGHHDAAVPMVVEHEG
jgi:CBS domain-containing protein